MDKINYPKRLPLAQLPTPLQPLNRLCEQKTRALGDTRVWVKRDDLTGSLCSGNKIRKLEFTLAQALEEGCDTVITCGGLQSNHCRATAVLCAELGLHCQLLLRGEPEGDPDGNLLLDYLVGTEVDCYPKRKYQAELPALFEAAADKHRQRGRKPFLIPTGASDEIGIWGYIAACEELAQDFKEASISPQHIVCATGSAGTQAGLTVGVVMHGIQAQVHGFAVCDDEQWFLNKMADDLRLWRARYKTSLDIDALNPSVIDQYIGPGYAMATQEIYDCINEIGRLEGLVLDPVYTGKAFYGMLEEMKKGRFEGASDIVFIHTGGVFGVFPHRQSFANSGRH